jgi:hypothetical protein
MKKLFVSISLLSTLMLSVSILATAQSRANFAGTWTLDMKKTRDLPAELKSYTLTVKQDAQQISYESRVEGELHPPHKSDQTGAGQETPISAPLPQANTSGAVSVGNPVVSDHSAQGSGSGKVMARGRALGMVIRRMTCTLDGKEAAREVGGISPGQIRRKAVWKKVDKSLEFNIARDFDVQGKTVTSTVKELWELSDDGKVLKVKRTVNLLAGWDEATLIFTRQ